MSGSRVRLGLSACRRCTRDRDPREKLHYSGSTRQNLFPLMATFLIVVLVFLSNVALLPIIAAAPPLPLPPLSPPPPGELPSDPTPWPPQFHSRQFMNFTSSGLQYANDLYYDWPNRRNINMLQRQLRELLYDVEWDNGTSFQFTVVPGGGDGNGGPQICKTLLVPVGILRPEWLKGATYLGRGTTDGFLCDVWEKNDFIWYFEDVVTRRPVRWDFFDGISTHVYTFEVGVVLEDSQWQAPPVCFADKLQQEDDVRLVLHPAAHNPRKLDRSDVLKPDND